LAIAPCTLVFFVASFGLFLSVQLSTVLRANLVFLVMVIGLAILSYVAPFGAGPLTFLEPLAYSWWQPGPNEVPRAAPVFGVHGIAGVFFLVGAFRTFDSRADHAAS
jgi:hypothetical protein